MFRTARGFLVVLPCAFVVALLCYLGGHGRGAQSFTPYPLLADSLGQGLSRNPAARFAVVSVVVFLVPYLFATVLLFLADGGAEVAGRLWGPPARKRVPPRLAVEATWTFVGASLLLSALGAAFLDRFARGGELPGGVNVGPFLVAAIPFAAAGVALVLATLSLAPRIVRSFFAGHAPPGPGGR